MHKTNICECRGWRNGGIELKHARARARIERMRSISNWPIGCLGRFGLRIKHSVYGVCVVRVCSCARVLSLAMQLYGVRVRHIKIQQFSLRAHTPRHFAALAASLAHCPCSRAIRLAASFIRSFACFSIVILFVWHAAKATSELNRMKNAKYFSRVRFLVSFVMLLVPAAAIAAAVVALARILFASILVFVCEFSSTLIAFFFSQSAAATSSCSRVCL